MNGSGSNLSYCNDNNTTERKVIYIIYCINENDISDFCDLTFKQNGLPVTTKKFIRHSV